MCEWQVKLCDAFVKDGPYLSSLEAGHYKALNKFSFFTILLPYFSFFHLLSTPYILFN